MRHPAGQRSRVVCAYAQWPPHAMSSSCYHCYTHMCVCVCEGVCVRKCVSGGCLSECFADIAMINVLQNK